MVARILRGVSFKSGFSAKSSLHCTCTGKFAPEEVIGGQGRVAQNATKVKNLQGALFHSCFFQVGEKNALKPAKNWWLGVAPGLAILSSIYLIDISEKWQILVEIIFDPSSCLENMNKHRETTWHIPKPHQGPKEHQNRALRSNFMNLEVTMSLKLGHFLTFFSISSNI